MAVNWWGREEKFVGEIFFTKRRKLLLGIANEKKGRNPEEAILSVTLQQPRLGLLLYADLACYSFPFC